MDTPRNIFGDIKRAQEDMEHLMRHVFGPSVPYLRSRGSKWKPNVDVFECKDSIVIVVELAGVAREDISVTFEDGKLRLSGVRKDDLPYKGRKYCQMEISYNEFERVIYLPENIDADKISAKLSNGIITIEAPKKRPEILKDYRVEIR